MINKQKIEENFDDLSDLISKEDDEKKRGQLIAQQKTLYEIIKSNEEIDMKNKEFEYQKKKDGHDLAYKKAKDEREARKEHRQELLEKEKIKIQQEELELKKLQLARDSQLEKSRRKLGYFQFVGQIFGVIAPILGVGGLVIGENKGMFINNKVNKLIK